jgi:hypothetical protein
LLPIWLDAFSSHTSDANLTSLRKRQSGFTLRHVGKLYASMKGIRRRKMMRFR